MFKFKLANFALIVSLISAFHLQSKSVPKFEELVKPFFLNIDKAENLLHERFKTFSSKYGATSNDKLRYQRSLKNLKTIDMISKGDIKGLQNLSKEDLDFTDPINKIFRLGGIELEGNYFKNNIQLGSLTSDNAIAFVLFRSRLNKTESDNKKTIKMLKIMLDKKVDLNTCGELSYWIENPKTKEVREFFYDMPLIKISIYFSFPEAIELLLQNGIKVSKSQFEHIISELDKKSKLKTLLNKYKSKIVKD